MTLSIVIPAHDEEGHLEATLRALVSTLEAEQVPHEVVVVDDHSTDGTAALLARLEAELPTVRRVANRDAPGFGMAIRAGLDAYTGDAVAIVMADASDDPRDVVRYYRTLEQGYDCVFGSRFVAGARVVNYPRQKLVLNRLANWIVRVLFGFAYNDVTNAFKAYRREVIDGIRPLLSCHFNLTVELPLKAIVRGYSYAVVPTRWYGRQHGFSKLKIKEMGSRYLFIVLYVLLERWLSRGDYARQAGGTTVPDRTGSGARIADPDAGLGRRERRWLDVAAVVLIALAFARGVSVTYDLDWPNDPDLYRDIAHAQTILDGSLLDDPHYLGETIWYNPLVPALVAGLDWVTGARLHVLETRAGAYLNLLAPIAFYLLARALLGRWTAVAATAVFLFCTGDTGPSYASSTYTPWLFVANFVQGVFYLAVLALHRAVETHRGHRFALVGILLGVTFLGHAAPAILVGGLVALYSFGRVVESARAARWIDVRKTLARLAVVLVLALVVSAPYLMSIVGNYQLHIVHRHPTFWIYPEMEVGNLGQFLTERLSRTLVLPALVGLVALLADRRARVARGWVLGWMGLSFAAIAYSYVWQILLARGVVWPSVVPGFHFLRYFNAGESLLAGYGIVTIGRALASMAAQWGLGSVRAVPVLRRATPVLLTSVLAAISYPAYASRPDLTNYRDQAKQMYRGPDVNEMFQWVRREVGPTDVVAAPENFALSLVGPAGRKVLVVDRFFSNPYVNWQARRSALDAIEHALDTGRCEAFQRVAAEFQVTHVLTRLTSVRPAVVEACGLETGFAGREWVIYRRRGPRPTRTSRRPAACPRESPEACAPPG